MAHVRVACSQITYGQFKQAEPDGYPEERILAEIAQAGYAGATSGPRADRTPRETRAVYESHGLIPVSGYLGVDWWKPEKRQDILDAAHRQAEFHAGIGCFELYVAAGGFDYVSRACGKTRSQLAGHVGPEDGLTDDEFKIMAERLNEVGTLTIDYGVWSCFHNHVGSVVETEAEMEKLLAMTEPSLLFLGPDVGHLAWAGADPVAFCERHVERIKTLHLKDAREDLVTASRAEAWDYGQFVGSGGWVELGDGMIDFPALFDVLARADYYGWAIVEIDRTPRASALESITASRQYLLGMGI